VNWILPVAAGAALLAVTVLLLRRRFATVMVDGDSMLPAFRAGDRVLVRRASLASLRTGQVVVVERPHRDGTWPKRQSGSLGGSQWMIKRVAGLPGDPLPPGCCFRLPDVSAKLVPPGTLVVLGDNARISHDSRQIGPFPGDRLLGVALRRVG
jgi:signal peptidase I